MNFPSPSKTLAVYSYLVILFFSFSPCKADNRLMTKLVPASAQLIKQAEKDFAKSAPDGTKIKKAPKLNLATNGFLAIYGGYYDFSDKSGFFQFPLRHEADKLFIVITPGIEVALLKGQTVSHMKAKAIDGTQMKAVFYQAEKKKLPDGSWVWNVKQASEPAGRKISKLSMIFLTDPSNISVPLGEFPAEASEHMTIPPMHITGRIGLEYALLNNMDVLRYFEQIQSKTDDTKGKGKVKISLVTNF